MMQAQEAVGRIKVSGGHRVMGSCGQSSKAIRMMQDLFVFFLKLLMHKEVLFNVYN